MEWALLVASLALVAVTIVYTVHTRAMAQEMKATRLLSITPRIVVDMHMLGPTFGAVRLANVGQGVAVDPTITWRVDALGETRRWTAHLLAPGESAEFWMRGADGSTVDMDAAVKAGAVVRVEGVVHDVYGERHPVVDEFDIAEWWTTIVEAEQAYNEEPMTKATAELEKTRRALESIDSELKRHRPR